MDLIINEWQSADSLKSMRRANPGTDLVLWSESRDLVARELMANKTPFCPALEFLLSEMFPC